MEPLASRIRPRDLDEFIGQKHLVGPGKPLRLAIEQGHIFSFVLWGPPGTGKTTLARIYANAINAEFHELSAVSAGKEDIRRILRGSAEPPRRSTKNHPVGETPQPLLGKEGSPEQRPRVLFLDEIHRFNKAQQD